MTAGRQRFTMCSAMEAMSRAYRRPVFSILLVVLLTLATSSSQTPPAPAVHFDPAGEAQLVTLINQARSAQGLPPLTVDERLTKAARKHSELMMQTGQLSHDVEGEPPLQIRIANQNLPADGVSENIAYNNRTIEAAHDGLMHSPPHRAAILSSDYDYVGVGVLRTGDEIYVTEDFAHKLPEYSEPEAEAVVVMAIDSFAKANGRLTPNRRPRLQLRQTACAMARNDALDSDALRGPGVHSVMAWTAADPAKLPKGASQVLLPEVSGYSLGACFAPSVSHPGGVYWIVMVTY